MNISRTFYECGFGLFCFPVLDFKQVCLVPFLFIVVVVNNDMFLNLCIKIWAGEVEENGDGGETVTTCQGFKAVSYSLALIKIGTARTVTSSYFDCLVEIECLEPVRFSW